MARKLSSGVMVALIAILSLFGSGEQAFAANAVGGPSLSTLVYAEVPELWGIDRYGNKMAATSLMNGATEFSEAEHWKAIDLYLSPLLYDASYKYFHVFIRRTFYDTSGDATHAYDAHMFYRSPVSDSPKVVRNNGKLKLINEVTGKDIAYEHLTNYRFRKTEVPLPTYKWDWYSAGLGMSTPNNDTEGNTTVIETMTSSTRYDPKKPPAYGVPGYTDPNYNAGNPGNPGNPDDPDFPSQPTPPDNNWDLIGWLRYIVEWLIYLVKCFVYFLKSFGTAIADVVTGSASLISAMSDFFAFLPNQVTTIIGMGIVAMIIVGIVKR
ncbi:hypothetical protein D3C78_488580 [compost metagenome]